MNSKFNFLPGSLNTSRALHFEAGSVLFFSKERETQKVAFFWCSHSALRCCDQTAVKLYPRMRFNGRYNLLWVAYGWRSTSDKIKQIVSHSEDLLIGLRDTFWHFFFADFFLCPVRWTSPIGDFVHIKTKCFMLVANFPEAVRDFLLGLGSHPAYITKLHAREWEKGMRQFWKTNGC